MSTVFVGKILIAPVDVAGYYARLVQGFKQLGIDADYITYATHPFGYRGETKNPFLLQYAAKLNRIRKYVNASVATKIICCMLAEIFTFIWTLSVIPQYNIFIFPAGKSLLRFNLDLPLLRLFGKIIIVNLGHGSDARPPYIDGSYLQNDASDADEIHNLQLLRRLASRLFLRVQFVFAFSSVVIGMPFSTSYFAPRKFINWFELGVPATAVPEPEQPSQSLSNASEQVWQQQQTIRILHAPSQSNNKGTNLIVKAINNLKSRGYLIDFVLITGRPHQEVFALIKECDFIVDQIYSDTPMATFASEAALFAKPAVVGGYGLGELKCLVDASMWPPSKICKPDDLENAIEDLICNPHYRKKLGNEAKSFVVQKWSPSQVARRYISLVHGTMPKSWWFYPLRSTYLFGCGLSRRQTLQRVSALITRYGSPALRLSNRPDLESMYLQLIGASSS